MNRITIKGNLTANPEVKLFDSNKVVNFKVATNERAFKTFDGREIPKRTEYHKVVVRGKLADFVETYLKKGHLVFLEGPVRTREYKDKDNKTIYVTEIHANNIDLLTPKDNNKSEVVSMEQPVEHESDLPF